MRDLCPVKKPLPLHYLALFLSLVFISSGPQQVSVEVVSSTTGGELFLAAYDSADAFESEEHVSNARQALSENAQTAELELRVPAAGHYVVAAFQDMNGNGKLDRNFFGVPTEPYGFAKLPPSKWRAPDYDEIKTRIDGPDRLTIELKHWNEY